MEILLNTLVVVANSSVADGIYVVSVVEAIVGKVVANTPNEDRYEIKLVQITDREQIALLEDNEHHLENVGTMDVVVIFNVTSVSLIDFAQEPGHFFDVKEGQSLFKAHLLHNVYGNSAHADFAPNIFHEGMDIEVKFIDQLKIFRVSIDLRNDCRKGGGLRNYRGLMGGARFTFLLSEHVVKVVLSALLHMDTGEFAEPASRDLALLLCRGQVELLNDVNIVNILLADLLDSIVDTLSDL
jgi:hypothetical protein